MSRANEETTEHMRGNYGWEAKSLRRPRRRAWLSLASALCLSGSAGAAPLAPVNADVDGRQSEGVGPPVPELAAAPPACYDCSNSLLRKKPRGFHEFYDFHPARPYEPGDMRGFGAIRCFGVEGTVRHDVGWIPGIVGRVRDVVVTSARAFVQRSGASTEPCYFYPDGEEPRIRISEIELRDKTPHEQDPDEKPDLAIGTLAKRISNSLGQFAYAVMEREDIHRYEQDGRVYFNLFDDPKVPVTAIGQDFDGNLVVSDNCGPIRMNDADLFDGPNSLMLNDCTILNIDSGGVLLAEYQGVDHVLCTKIGKYANYYYGENGGAHFDPRTRLNFCVAMDPKTNRLMKEIARRTSPE